MCNFSSVILALLVNLFKGFIIYMVMVAILNEHKRINMEIPRKDCNHKTHPHAHTCHPSPTNAPDMDK